MDTVTVELPGHGEFKALRLTVERINSNDTKVQLAKHIADIYGGNTGESSSYTYWLKNYSKYVLAVVLAGLTEPRN